MQAPPASSHVPSAHASLAFNGVAVLPYPSSTSPVSFVLSMSISNPTFHEVFIFTTCPGNLLFLYMSESHRLLKNSIDHSLFST